VKWWKIKNLAYSQAEGRHELINRTGRSHVSRWHDDILRYRRQAGSTKLAGE